jgi:hypothetical protein
MSRTNGTSSTDVVAESCIDRFIYLMASGFTPKLDPALMNLSYPGRPYWVSIRL